MSDLISRQAAIDALDEYIEEYSSDLDENGYHNPKWCAMQEARTTIQRLPSAQPGQRWIPCSERLPGHPEKISRQEAVECNGFREVERDDERRSN